MFTPRLALLTRAVIHHYITAHQAGPRGGLCTDRPSQHITLLPAQLAR